MKPLSALVKDTYVGVARGATMIRMYRGATMYVCRGARGQL